MKMTLYLTEHHSRILDAMVDLIKADHPNLGKRGPLINEAVANYAHQMVLNHIKNHGASPRIKARLKELAAALDKFDHQ